MRPWCTTSLYHTQTFIVAPPVKWEYHFISTCPWSYRYGLGKRVPPIFKIGWLLHFCPSHSIISTTKWAVNMATFYHKKLLLQWIQSDTASSAQLYVKVFVEWVPEQNQCIYIFNLQIPEFMGTYNLQILAPRHFWVHTTCYISLVPRVLHTRMATIEIVKAVPVASFPGRALSPSSGNGLGRICVPVASYPGSGEKPGVRG